MPRVRGGLCRIGFALYVYTLPYPFVFDDAAATADNASLRAESLWTALIVCGRPLVKFSFGLNQRVFGDDP